MHWIGSGFVSIINYGTYAEAEQETFTILTEAGDDLLTENGSALLTEQA